MALVQYIGVALGASVFVSFASLVWPKLTSQPRPQPLTQVREVVIQTPLGAQVANVLGVTDEVNVTPVHVGTFVAEQANAAVVTVQKSAQRAVTSRVLHQLAGQFDQLPEDQKVEFQKLVCDPVE